MALEQQKYSTSGIITLYEIDFSAIPNFTTSTKLYFTGKKNSTASIVWPTSGGDTYVPADIVSDGFGSEIGAAPPEPTLVIGYRDLSENSTFQGVETAWTSQGLGNAFDWRGTKIVRTRIFETHLSATTNAMQDEWYVDQLQRIDQFGYYFKLGVGLGIERISDRSVRRMSHAMCSLRYRIPHESSTDVFYYIDTEHGGCPWGNSSETSNYTHLSTFGTPYKKIDETSTSTWSEDSCNKTLGSCTLRFDPSSAGHPLPFVGLFRAGTKRTIDK